MPGQLSVTGFDLEAARLGSYPDLVNLQRRVNLLPTSILPQAFEVFLSRLDSKKLPPTRRLTAKEAYTPTFIALDVAMYSLRGLCRIACTDYFETDPSLADRLCERWEIIVKAITVMHDSFPLTLEFDFVKDIRNMTIKTMSRIRKMRYYTDGLWTRITYDLLLKFWMDADADMDMLTLCSYHLLECLQDAKDFYEVFPDDRKVVRFVNLALGRLARALKNVRIWKKQIVEFDPFILFNGFTATLLERTKDTGAHVVVGRRGVTVYLNVLRLLHRGLQDGSLGEQSHRSVHTCFDSLQIAFNVSPNSVRRAIRGGLIEIIFAFSPYFSPLGLLQGFNSKTLTAILTSSISGALINKKTVEIAADAVKRLSKEERIFMTKSILNAYWSELEAALAERFMLSRFEAYSRRMSSCETCRKVDKRQAFRRCGGCHQLSYCSKSCQRTSWNNLGHRYICKDKAALGANKTGNCVLKQMIRRDCDRYLRDAVADTLGSPDALDTSKFTVCLDYRKLPTTISIRSNPVKISSGHIDYELKRSHKEEGKTGYCAILRHGSGLKLETGCYYRTDPEWQHRNRAPPRWFSRAPMRIEVGDSSFDVPKNISDYLDHIIQNQASSFEEFWTLNLDESVHKWHLEVNGGMALFNRLAAACKPTRRGHWMDDLAIA